MTMLLLRFTTGASATRANGYNIITQHDAYKCQGIAKRPPGKIETSRVNHVGQPLGSQEIIWKR